MADDIPLPVGEPSVDAHKSKDIPLPSTVAKEVGEPTKESIPNGETNGTNESPAKTEPPKVRLFRLENLPTSPGGGHVMEAYWEACESFHIYCMNLSIRLSYCRFSAMSN